MKRPIYKIILAFLSLVLLCTGVRAASADRTTDAPTSYAKKSTYADARKRKSLVNRLGDRDEGTYYSFSKDEWVSVRWKNAEVDFVYFEWTDKIGVDPAPYTIELLDADGGVLETREGEPYWNNGVEIAEGVFGVRLTPHADAELCTLIPYIGGAPKDYHPWQPTVQKAGFLVIAMHPDDDCLFMGNVVATYGAERGFNGTILYLATRTRVRRTEALNGAWIMGLRTYPLMAGLPNIGAKYREARKNEFLPEDVERVLVRYLRRLKPEVAVTHDDNGEYGHWQHIMIAETIRLAVKDAADPAYDPDSASQYGVWQVKKLYLHLAAENPIFITATEPLAAFDGRTGLEVAQEAYQCHQSQRLWNHLCNNENECSLERFGLVFSTVGLDTGINDLFEHIDPTPEQTPEPTAEPTPEPTEEPTPEPTAEPSAEPTLAPTQEPTTEPTEEPAIAPQQTPAPTPGKDRTEDGDRTFRIVLASAVLLLAIALFAVALIKRQGKAATVLLFAALLLLLLAAVLLIRLFVCI